MLFRGPVHIAYLMVFAVLWGLSMTFEMPARQTLMVELVGKKDLVNAIALNSAMVNSARVIGPAMGGLLLGYFRGGLVLSFGCRQLSGGPLRPAPNPASRIALRAQEGKGRLEIYSGRIQIFKDQSHHRAVDHPAFHCGTGRLGLQSQLSAFAVTQLHLGAQGYGWMLAVNGLGACTAALFVAAQGSRIVRVKTLYAGAGIFAVFIVLFGFMHQPVGAAFLLFFAGFGIILFYSIGNSILQTQSPDHLRGRLMGIWALVFGGSMPVGSFWMGVAAQKVGSGHALQAGGIFCALGAVTVYLLGRKIRS